MGITRDYFALQQHFEKKYGENTICLIQIGKFYEIYEFDYGFDTGISLLALVQWCLGFYLHFFIFVRCPASLSRMIFIVGVTITGVDPVLALTGNFCSFEFLFSPLGGGFEVHTPFKLCI